MRDPGLTRLRDSALLSRYCFHKHTECNLLNILSKKTSLFPFLNMKTVARKAK